MANNVGVVRVNDFEVDIDFPKMEINKLYQVDFHGLILVYKKVSDTKMEVYQVSNKEK